jgi:hypothetical protein
MYKQKLKQTTHFNPEDGGSLYVERATIVYFAILLRSYITSAVGKTSLNFHKNLLGNSHSKFAGQVADTVGRSDDVPFADKD